MLLKTLQWIKHCVYVCVCVYMCMYAWILALRATVENRLRWRNMLFFLLLPSGVSLLCIVAVHCNPALSSFKNPNHLFGTVLSISVPNNHYNKEGEERNKNRCLCSRAHFKVLLWPLKSTLANTWLQWIDSNPIYLPFLPFICSLLCKLEGKERFEKFQKEKKKVLSGFFHRL